MNGNRGQVFVMMSVQLCPIYWGLVEVPHWCPKFLEFSPYEVKNIILREVRFNPREVQLMPMSHLSEILHSLMFNILQQNQLDKNHEVVL